MMVVAGFVVVVGFDSHWGVERKVQPWTESVLVPIRCCLGGYCYEWEAGQDDGKRSHLPINTETRYVPAAVGPLLSITSVGRTSTLSTQ